MFCKRTAALATLATFLFLPLAGEAQTYSQRRHDRIRAQQRASDRRHHTKAKVVGGSAVGGAVVGGLLGGGKGAVIGAGVGAGGGLLANKARVHHDDQKRAQREY